MMKNIFKIVVAGLFLTTSAAAIQAKDAGHSKDYRTFHANGEIEYGDIGDSYTSSLVMYLAGNQFMVMEELIKDFQSKNTDIETIYVETIPPGQIFKGQLLKQGKIDGKETSMNPDIFDSNDSDSSRDDDYFSSLSESALSILMENHAIVDEEGKDCCFHAMSPREELL